VIGYILFGQNHLYVKMLCNRDSAIQKCFGKFCTNCKLEKPVPCQPSGRCVIPFGRPSVHTSSRPDDVSYCPDARQTKASSVRTTWISVRTLLCIEKLLFQLTSIQTSQQPVRTPLSIRPSFRFFPKSNMGKLLQSSRRRGFPSRRASP
jgi:hypothetical protein